MNFAESESELKAVCFRESNITKTLKSEYSFKIARLRAVPLPPPV